jgi:hypothetical protein
LTRVLNRLVFVQVGEEVDGRVGRWAGFQVNNHKTVTRQRRWEMQKKEEESRSGIERCGIKKKMGESPPSPTAIGTASD